jgi:hypothetical protein
VRERETETERRRSKRREREERVRGGGDGAILYCTNPVCIRRRGSYYRTDLLQYSNREGGNEEGGVILYRSCTDIGGRGNTHHSSFVCFTERVQSTDGRLVVLAVEGNGGKGSKRPNKWW